MSEQSKSKRKAKPLLMVGAGIALLTMASGSLSCGNLPSRTCGDGGVQDPCSSRFVEPTGETSDAGTATSDAGTDGGVLGGDR